MSNRILISDAKRYDGQEVVLCGFVHEVRDLKKMQFVVLRDISGDMQVTVFKNESSAGLVSTVAGLSLQSSIRVSGTVKIDDFVKMGGVELLATDIQVSGHARSPLPIDVTGMTDSGASLRYDWRFLDLRDSKRQLIFKVQNTMLNAMRELWYRENFVEIFSPKLVPTPSEGGAELFELDYFGSKAYLAQSPQVYKQMAIASGLDRVCEIGSAFRADKSHTNRHMTEFVSVDIEMAWINSVDDVMSHQEKWIAHFVQAVKDRYGDAIKTAFGVEVTVPTLPFVRLTMAQAKDIVAASGYVVPQETKGDLDPQSERLIAQHVKEKYNHDFVFVVGYPTSIRPFYHMRDGASTCSFDLIYKGIEICTGAQREHRLDVLIKQAIEKEVLMPNAVNSDGSLNPAHVPQGMDSYLNCFDYGCPPHGGFGFGLSRMLMQLLQLDNVKEAVYISRTVERISP